MNLNHLRYFYVVAQERGFTAASRALRIQQPAISRMVKQLEDDFGFKLFEKVGRNVRLTSRGQDVFRHCQKIFGDIELLEASVKEVSGELKGPLVLGAAEPVASHFLPRALAVFTASHARVQPTMLTATASSIVNRLVKGELELAFLFHTPTLPASIQVVRKLKTRFRFVVRRDLQKDRPTLSKFIGSREVDDVTASRFPALTLLKKSVPEATLKISSNNLTAHKQLVLEGAGVSILPEFLVKEELKNGRLAELFPKSPFVYDLKILKRRATELSPVARSFLEIIEN